MRGGDTSYACVSRWYHHFMIPVPYWTFTYEVASSILDWSMQQAYNTVRSNSRSDLEQKWWDIPHKRNLRLLLLLQSRKLLLYPLATVVDVTPFAVKVGLAAITVALVTDDPTIGLLLLPLYTCC